MKTDSEKRELSIIYQGLHGLDLTQAMQERGNEIRTFMPRYGCINERRHQLHEVIRLSGMNLIIDDNDDFFARKAVLNDADGHPFEDNDGRMVFFARGVIETVKKLRWTPDIVHCHGWFSSIVPVYLRKAFDDDPVFRNSKIVMSFYDDRFTEPLGSSLRSKIEGEGIKDKNLPIIDTPSYENLCRYVMTHIDGAIAGSRNADNGVLELARQCGKPVLEYHSPDEEGFYENYNRFYEDLL